MRSRILVDQNENGQPTTVLFGGLVDKPIQGIPLEHVRKWFLENLFPGVEQLKLATTAEQKRQILKEKETGPSDSTNPCHVPSPQSYDERKENGATDDTTPSPPKRPRSSSLPALLLTDVDDDMDGTKQKFVERSEKFGKNNVPTQKSESCSTSSNVSAVPKIGLPSLRDLDLTVRSGKAEDDELQAMKKSVVRSVHIEITTTRRFTVTEKNNQRIIVKETEIVEVEETLPTSPRSANITHYPEFEHHRRRANSDSALPAYRSAPAPSVLVEDTESQEKDPDSESEKSDDKLESQQLPIPPAAFERKPKGRRKSKKLKVRKSKRSKHSKARNPAGVFPDDYDPSELPDVTFQWLYHWLGCTPITWLHLSTLNRTAIQNYHYEPNHFPSAEERELHRILVRLKFLYRLFRRQTFFLGYDKTTSEERLRNEPVGMYMVRLSATVPGYITVSCTHSRHGFVHIRFMVFNGGVIQPQASAECKQTIEPGFLSYLASEKNSYLSRLPAAVAAELPNYVYCAPLKVYRNIEQMPRFRSMNILTTHGRGYEVSSNYISSYLCLYD